MTEAWNDRKKALEEDYFRKKEQEAIEKLRAKRAAAEGGSAVPKCPKCDGALMEISYDEVEIDRCTQCGGVWLDPGELERLTRQTDSGGFIGRLFKSLSGER
jgi:hypothetical protein